MKRLTLVLIGTMTALAGCDDLPVSSVPEADPGPAAFAIIDGANGDPDDLENPLVTANTFFLPSLVADPVASGDATGTFDPTHRPVFEIWEMAEGNGCGVNGNPVARFTMDSGPGSETIRVVPEDEHYIANWHTGSDESAVDPDCTYQIRVLTAGVTAATADVQIASDGSGLRNIDTGEDVALKDGGTLAIKVRIQEFCDAEETSCSAGFIDPDQGGTVSLFDPDNGNLVAELDCPEECADQPFVLSLTLLADDANPSPDLDPDNQFPYFVEASTVPDDVLLDGAVFTVCQTVEVQEDRDADVNLLDAFLRLFRVDDGLTEIRDDPEFAPECATPNVIGQVPAAGEVLFAGTPLQPVGTLLRRAAALIGPEPLGATSFFLHGGLNTTLRNEPLSEWGATDVAQIEATVLVDGDEEEGVPVSVEAPSPDFNAEGTTGGDGTVLFEHLPIAANDPYTVSIDENDLPGVTCTTTSEDVALDVPGETETVTFTCTTDSGTIEVTVLDQSEGALEGITVDLVDGFAASATTSANGVATFSDVPLGTYQVSATLQSVSCGSANVTLSTDGEVQSATLVCPLFSAAGVGDVDGENSTGEWDAAVCHSFQADLPDGGETPAEFCVMNDDSDVYFRLLVDRSPDPQSLFFVEFDADDNNTVGLDPDDDLILVQQPPQGGFFRDEVVLSSGTVDDTQQGGTIDGAGAHAPDGQQSLFEMSHPLSSGDANDIAVSVGDVIQFQVGIALTEPATETTTETTAVTRVPSGTGAGTTGFLLEIAPFVF